MQRRGYTIIELLIVIAIIAVLFSIVQSFVFNSLKVARYTRAKAELNEVAKAAQMYAIEHGDYPADVDRAIPPGIQEYLGPGEWPDAPWKGSVYDWDNVPEHGYVQISIRFCPLGVPAECNFPVEDWAKNFDYHSSVYYCMRGPCRAHPNKSITHPALCINC